MVVAIAVTATMLSFTLGIAADADADGYFVSRGPAPSSEVHAGPGVRFAAVDAEGRVVGRLAAGADEGSIWVREDGRLSSLPLRAETTAEALRPSVRESVLAALAGRGGDVLSAFLASCDVTTAATGTPRGDAAAPVTSRTPLPPPSPRLEDWAPKECLFVRFRSVEAAYRCVSLADEIAGALLAAEREDARDYGTLRLALHDLLLPTIWRTNPDAERGVGEAALVLAPPFVRGRPRAALLLRITDPELHRMQTVAGIAQESAEDHRWRPADDPFPQERERFNFRVVPEDAPFLEIVATDRELGERIASRRSATVGTLPEWQEARALTAPGGRPAPEEAAFAWSSLAVEDDWRALVGALTRSAARETREAVGLAWLAKRWFDASRLTERPDVRSHGPAALDSIQSLRVTTDAKGASVRVRCADEHAAARFASVLASLPAAGPAAARACRASLADLAPLALVENPQTGLAERNFVVLGWKPVCPCGGVYAAHPVTREVSCSEHGTLAAPREGRWRAPPLSEVSASGAELSFRVAIDWNRKE